MCVCVYIVYVKCVSVVCVCVYLRGRVSLLPAASGQGVQGLQGGEQPSLTTRPPTQSGAAPPQSRVLAGTHLETHTHTEDAQIWSRWLLWVRNTNRDILSDMKINTDRG